MFLVVSLLLVLLAGSDGGEELNVQDCTNSNEFSGTGPTDIYYHIVNSSDDSSCMHFVWSTVEHPALYLAHTEESTDCVCSKATFDEKNYPDNNTVRIPGLHSNFSLMIIFTRLIEFNATDASLTGGGLNQSVVCNETLFSHNASYSNVALSNLNWTFTSATSTFIGSLPSQDNDTIISISTTIPRYANYDRLKYFPKTLFSSTSTTFDIVTENYPFKNNVSRLALEVMLIHGENVENGSIDIKKTTDDEYTPSVFSSITYTTSVENVSDSVGGFIQWKPISYQTTSRKSTSSQQVTILPAWSPECVVTEVPRGLASGMYGGDVTETMGNATRWLMVFGTLGDDSYINPSYNTWTVVTGYGDAPVDKFSLTVIITIIVGVGVPVALVILGGVYVFIRKKPWQKAQRWMNSKRGRGYSRLS